MSLNNGYCYQETLNQDAKGFTVLSYLVKHYRHSSEQLWEQRLADGEVKLDNTTASGKEVLHPGSLLSWNRPPWREDDTPQHYDVIYQDDDLLVINKPSGLPTMPAGNFLRNTLFSLVRSSFPEATPQHRLGRGTSGLVVFTLNKKANVTMSGVWRQHQVKKFYLALSAGCAEHETYEITQPIGLVNHPRLGTLHAATENGKPSLSFARVLQKSADATLFNVEIKTGRPHQIRIHLASLGYPLLGDPLYGIGGLPISEALPGDGGYFLHASRLEFLHPSSRTLLQLTVSLPQGFKDKLSNLKIKNDL